MWSPTAARKLAVSSWLPWQVVSLNNSKLLFFWVENRGDGCERPWQGAHPSPSQHFVKITGDVCVEAQRT